MITNRRTVLRYSAGGLASASLLCTGLFARAEQPPHATLATLVFISKRLDASTADYRNWYIEHHAPDFLSFAKPYLRRYTQDFVEKGHMGDVDFDCISEFEYRSAESRDALQKATVSPEALKTLAAHPKIGSQPGPHEDHGGPRTFSINEELLAGPARGYDPRGTRKQAVLLRRKAGASPDSFAAAAKDWGIAAGKGPAERVVLELAVPEGDRPAPLYDGVLLIWPKKDSSPATGLGAPPDAVTVANIIDLVSYEPNLGA